MRHLQLRKAAAWRRPVRRRNSMLASKHNGSKHNSSKLSSGRPNNKYNNSEQSSRLINSKRNSSEPSSKHNNRLYGLSNSRRSSGKVLHIRNKGSGRRSSTSR